MIAEISDNPGKVIRTGRLYGPIVGGKMLGAVFLPNRNPNRLAESRLGL